MIRTVAFDIDGTLYDYDEADKRAVEACVAEANREFGVRREDYLAALKDAHAESNRRWENLAASHSRVLRFEILMEALGLPVVEGALKLTECYWKTFLEDIRPEEGLIPLLEALRAKGVRLGIGTNMTSYIQFAKLRKLGVGRFFDFVVTSEAAGEEKPSRAFYEYVLRKAECAPEECIFIGDQLVGDVEGAKAAGMHAVLCGGEHGIRYTDCLTAEGIVIGGIRVPGTP